jgi:hypothetical protein
MKQGTLNVMVGGMPAAIDVYDDGLVFVPGSKGAQAGMLFGALGALIGGAAARRGLTKRREQLDALQASSASQAVAVEGCQVLAPGDIRSIEVKKGLLGAGRRLTIDRTTGRKLSLVYNSKKQPTSQVDALLRPVVGERLRVLSGA